MAEKQNTPVESAETEAVAVATPAKESKGKQISPWFTNDELAHIQEAQFVKRQLKVTDLVRAAVLEYIKDVPKPE